MSTASTPELSQTAISILIVDDDEVFRKRLGRAFSERGYEVFLAADYAEAVGAAQRESPELAIIDLRMGSRSGLELLQELLRLDPATKIVVLTGYGSIATAIDAIRLGATYYLPKPADVDDIITAFSRGERPALEPPLTPHSVPSLARAEWEHISRVLSDCGNNISEAARRLSIHRRSLQRKLQKYPPNT